MRGLKGGSIADLYAEEGISQTQYYRWRDQFPGNSWKAFEDNNRRE